MGVVNKLGTLVVVAAFLASCMSQGLSYAGEIRGRVVSKDKNAPIVGAKVSTAENSKTATTTDGDGMYKLMDVTAGLHTIVAVQPRYYPASKQNVRSGETADFQLLEIRLGRAAAGIVKADLSSQLAKELLPAARKAEDPVAIYLLANRLAE